MRQSVIRALVAFGVAGAAPALAQEAPTTVVRDGDTTMTCRQMADEAAELSAGMGEGGGGLLGRVRTVAETGAAILVPGAGLAMAGADALTTSGAERREAEAAPKRDRWNYLNGLYAGRGCGEQETAASQTPPAEAVPAGVVPETAPTPTTSAPRITPAALPR